MVIAWVKSTIWSRLFYSNPHPLSEINANRRRGCNCGTWINHSIVSGSFSAFPLMPGLPGWPTWPQRKDISKLVSLLLQSGASYLVGKSWSSSTTPHPPWHSDCRLTCRWVITKANARIKVGDGVLQVKQPHTHKRGRVQNTISPDVFWPSGIQVVNALPPSATRCGT